MNTHRLHTVLIRFRASFLAAFPALSAQDLRTILAGPSDTLLEILQVRYGYSRAEAIAAWNDFVLAYVDGHTNCGSALNWDAGWSLVRLAPRSDRSTMRYLH